MASQNFDEDNYLKKKYSTKNNLTLQNYSEKLIVFKADSISQISKLSFTYVFMQKSI